jgi:3',5'-cyclic AMP phosphodiesterase CpdA
MHQTNDRREFLKLLSVGGVVFASGLVGCKTGAWPSPPSPATPSSKPLLPEGDFVFLQLSDTHWGYQGAANPESGLTLKRTVATINAAPVSPDFIVFTGDLTHSTDDATHRRARMSEFREIVSALKVKNLKFLPGEHDTGPDQGAMYREMFGDPNFAFTHKGVHFIALDNVSMPGASLGDAQLAWLSNQVRALPRAAPLVVFAHRPLFDLYPDWDWTTKDGGSAIDILATHEDVTVFYGHIHQEHHHYTGQIAHHSARSLIFPLPAPGSTPSRAPLEWNPRSPDHGIGYRSVKLQQGAAQLTELAPGKTE